MLRVNNIELPDMIRACQVLREAEERANERSGVYITVQAKGKESSERVMCADNYHWTYKTTFTYEKTLVTIERLKYWTRVYNVYEVGDGKLATFTFTDTIDIAPRLNRTTKRIADPKFRQAIAKHYAQIVAFIESSHDPARKYYKYAGFGN